MKSFINFTSWVAIVCTPRSTQSQSSLRFFFTLYTPKHQHRRLWGLCVLLRRKTAVELGNVVSVCSRLDRGEGYFEYTYMRISVGVCLNFFNIYIRSHVFLFHSYVKETFNVYFLFFFRSLSLFRSETFRLFSLKVYSSSNNTATKLQRNWIISRRYYLWTSKWRHGLNWIYARISSKFWRVIKKNVVVKWKVNERIWIPWELYMEK